MRRRFGFVKLTIADILKHWYFYLEKKCVYVTGQTVKVNQGFDKFLVETHHKIFSILQRPADIDARLVMYIADKRAVEEMSTSAGFK